MNLELFGTFVAGALVGHIIASIRKPKPQKMCKSSEDHDWSAWSASQPGEAIIVATGQRIPSFIQVRACKICKKEEIL